MNFSFFRPCIDLHEGQVKQIVGSSLTDSLQTNFVSLNPPSYYSALYRKYSLKGAHVIKLGTGNDEAALDALNAWPHSLQLGGGVTIDNAQYWLDSGAEKVIVTSWLFPNASFDQDRLRRICEKIGRKSLVVDLSCKTHNGSWRVAMDKWKTLTDIVLNEETIHSIGEFADEFLVHAADVEGLCQGIDERLVKCLGDWTKIPCTYAGGAKDLSDIQKVSQLSNGKVDLTYGSALDIFGGNGVKFMDLVEWNNKRYY